MKKIFIPILIFLLIAAALLVYWFNFVFINHTFYPLKTEVLDLSGQKVSGALRIPRMAGLKQLNLSGTGVSPEEYEYIHQALPDCEITWDLAFQGSFYSPDTTVISVDTLSDRDVELLDSLPDLTLINALQCTDYEQLKQLHQHHPNCRINYSFFIDGTKYSSNARSLTIQNPDMTELLDKLVLFLSDPQIHLAGKIPEPEDLIRLMEAYPNIAFSRDVKGQHLYLGLNTTELDLSGVPLTVAEAKNILACYPKLKQVDMLECGLTDEEMLALTKDYPDCLLVWDLCVASIPFRTDSEEIDFSNHEIEDVSEIEAMLPYFPNLKKVVMCDCGIPSGEMDALNKRHDDIQFVWMIYAGNVPVRTDALFFAPVKYGENVYDKDLTELHYCHDIIAVDVGHMYITDISWVASMPNLQYLIIADAPVSDISPLANHEKLVFLEMFLTLCRDYTPLLTCTGLEDLNLCWTYGTSDVIRQMTWLKRLWWDGNWVATKGLEEYLPDTECNFHSSSSTGGSWRAGEHYKEQRDILGMPYMYG